MGAERAKLTMAASSQPQPHDSGRAALERLCALALERLDAERVLVWRYSAWSRLVSPIAGRRPDHESGPAAPSWWARRNIEEVEPFETCLQERRTVVASRERLREVAWDLAEDLVGDSITCAPLLLHDQPLGMMTVEPAPSSEAAATLSHLSACAAPLLAWQTAERGRTQAELLLEVIEAAGAHSGSLGELLYMVCARLARELGVTRASIFLQVGDRLAPRMASFSDGRKDNDAWLRFRDSQDVPPMVEAAFAAAKPVRATHRRDPKLGEWWAERFGIQSAVAVPLASPPVGVLMLDSSVPRSFRSDETRVISGFGSLLGEIVRRNQQAEERESRLAAGESVRELLKHGLASPDVAHMAGRLALIARQAVGSAVAVVCVPGEGGLRPAGRDGSEPALLDRLPKSFEWSASHELAGAAAVVDATDDDSPCGRLVRRLGLATGVVVPLVGYEDGRGVLVCGSGQPRLWSQRRLELASQLGLEGGLVLEAARLRDLDRARQVELQHRAHHDPLTGLGNRSLFYERAEAALATVSREGLQLALLLIDLDGFKDINDGLGHEHGDRLLVEVAGRLRGALREGDIVARLGGDEFAIALTSNVSRQSALTAAQRIVGALTEPIALGGIEVSIGASIGIALFPEHGETVEVVMRHADAAMYEAKREHSGIEVYERQAGKRQTPALLVQRLRHAIAERRLVLHYQPKVDLRSGRVSGAEALVRWQQPDGSYVPPAEFIPLAEATGLIREITPLVIADALEECGRWAEDGLDLDVAVNVTPPDVSHPDFPRLVEAALERSGVEGGRLTVEITESSLIRNQTQVIAVLRELAELGVSVSLDDFGTGYSSLGLLDQLPVRELKIDRGFLRDGDRATTTAIIQSVVSLGHTLGLQIVAEGVETHRSLANVTRLGCDVAQGYYYTKPLPAAEFRAWVATGNVRKQAA